MLPRDNFNSWGHVLFADMIQMAGIHHCNFRVIQRVPNYYALVYCFMRLFTKNKTARQVAEIEGIKLNESIWRPKADF